MRDTIDHIQAVLRSCPGIARIYWRYPNHPPSSLPHFGGASWTVVERFGNAAERSIQAGGHWS